MPRNRRATGLQTLRREPNTRAKRKATPAAKKDGEMKPAPEAGAGAGASSWPAPARAKAAKTIAIMRGTTEAFGNAISVVSASLLGLRVRKLREIRVLKESVEGLCRGEREIVRFIYNEKREKFGQRDSCSGQLPGFSSLSIGLLTAI
ncbi:hypothetical protein OWV82_018147 [Melia azedarach]|uniref:Uncharacterized protein n=1 Tax=Melia azedarach TaxID=155640 RepID=A0ACC1XAG1_MELAZ|nr:hypothetical protein OWV82_018147 [Melia azedarach]